MSYQKVADAIALALKCVLVFLGHPPDKLSDFPAMKKIVVTYGNFLDTLKTFEKQSITDKVINRVKPIVLGENFKIADMVAKGPVPGGLATWCKAIYDYSLAWKIVEPKEKEAKELGETLRIKQAEVARQ
jgi:hypothetical protein